MPVFIRFFGLFVLEKKIVVSNFFTFVLWLKYYLFKFRQELIGIKCLSGYDLLCLKNVVPKSSGMETRKLPFAGC